MNAKPEGGGGPKWVLIACALVLVGTVLVFAWRAKAPRLVDQLSTPGANTIAYQKLLEQGPAAVEDLLEVAQDPKHMGRADAIELLGRIGDPRAVPALLALEDPHFARERIEALGKIPDERTLPPLLEALDGSDVELSLSALTYLAERDDAPIKDLETFLASGRPSERALAARAMGHQRHMPALGILLEMLGDPSPQVRLEAAKALLQLGDPEGNAAVDRAVARGAVSFEE